VLDRPRARLPWPWLLVAGSALLAALLAYVLFAGYIPARRHIARLEAELTSVYARETELQSRVGALEQRLVERERRIAALEAQVRAARRAPAAERGSDRPSPGRPALPPRRP
jgi:hypothetical protein